MTAREKLRYWQHRLRVRRSRLIGFQAKERHWRGRVERARKGRDRDALARAESMVRHYVQVGEVTADLYERAQRGARRYRAAVDDGEASEHFSIREFDCKDGTPVPKAAEPAVKVLADRYLEKMRDRFGPCVVHSGYRHRAYNRSIGGATSSQHIYDDSPESVAADCSFADGTPAEWAAYARTLPGVGGVGEYRVSRFVHIDTGGRRDWRGN